MKTAINLCVLVALAIAGLAACVSRPESETRPQGRNVLDDKAIHAAMTGRVSFVKHIKPVLEDKCVMCHNRRSMPGHMSLENRGEAKRTGALGSFIISGHPEHSLLIAKAEGGTLATGPMPVVGMRLTNEEKAILAKWVKEGAAWPSGSAGVLSVRH